MLSESYSEWFFSTYKSFLSLRNIISAFSKFSFEIFQFQNLNYNLEDSDQQFQDRQYVHRAFNIIQKGTKTTKFTYCK